MFSRIVKLLMLFLIWSGTAHAQNAVRRSIKANRITSEIKIDGNLTEPEWLTAGVADNFVMYNPEPFIPETKDNATEIYFLYNDKGIYIGGFLHEKSNDSIASELIGRDGFGNNDFIGIVFDTYHDKLNGFEYFLTPLGEQMDSKLSANLNGSVEDFSWNSVWQGSSRIQEKGGWTFEMFLPFSAIRFGKEKIQNWGLNIVRRRLKSGQKLFWQSLDPNVSGFLTQEGTMTGLEDIKPPLRLQFSPYLSTYLIHDKLAADHTSSSVNGGMDLKYGINQAFTLDLTLIPDFGQVQSDDRVLNLSPFEQQFSENRTFFTEGTELFSKGGLFYSRRIGGTPIHYSDVEDQTATNETIVKNPSQSKLINATKISGRSQNGLAIGVLNAITKPQYAVIENDVTGKRKYETNPLTNYNVFVLDQTYKHNSSISFVNTNVTRNGNDYDANVSSFLFDKNDKTNTWQVGGYVSISALLNKDNKNTVGYAHSFYLIKTSGRLNFSVWQDLLNSKYDKSDLGYFTNNNTMDQGFWLGYKWTKPRAWYNQMRLNFNFFHSRLVSPIDVLKRRDLMFQNTTFNINGNAQTKRLWQIGATINGGTKYNDFYEPRVSGRVFRNKGRAGISGWWNSNSAKKLSWGGNVFLGKGGIFNYTSYSGGLFGTIRFSSKFSVTHSGYIENSKNQIGWAKTKISNLGVLNDTINFSKRNIHSVENVLSFKYNFTNKAGLTLRARHSWSKVDPKEFFELDTDGGLRRPATPFTDNVNQNYNYLSIDMLFNWQFAEGSFFSVAWKNLSENWHDSFEKNYFNNLGKTIGQTDFNNINRFNSFSVRVIYFLDYLSLKKVPKKK